MNRYSNDVAQQLFARTAAPMFLATGICFALIIVGQLTQSSSLTDTGGKALIGCLAYWVATVYFVEPEP